MDAINTIFGNITVSQIIVFFIAVIAIIGIGKKIYKWIVNFHDTLQAKEENMKKLCEKIDEIKSNQDKITIEVNNLSQRQDELYARQEAFEKDWRDFNLNAMRDNLLQGYRYYTNLKKNPMQAWTEMEKDVFDNIFNNYEKLGGNGFMHSVVQPEMSKLDIIKMSNDTKIKELYASRGN